MVITPFHHFFNARSPSYTKSHAMHANCCDVISLIWIAIKIGCKTSINYNFFRSSFYASRSFAVDNKNDLVSHNKSRELNSNATAQTAAQFTTSRVPIDRQNISTRRLKNLAAVCVSYNHNSIRLFKKPIYLLTV